MNLCQAKTMFLIATMLTLIISIIFIYNVRIEGMKVRYNCPDSLTKTNDGLYQLSYENNKKPTKTFYNLEEYVKMIRQQKKDKVVCPILELKTPNLSPAELNPTEDEKITELLDANRDGDTYNTNQYPGYDPMNLYIGIKTPLDKQFNIEESKNVSGNAMDTNWGGVNYSREQILSGAYKK